MKQITLFISIVLGLALAGHTAFAQEKQYLEGRLGETYSLDSTTVTAARTPVLLHSSARVVTLMDSLEIASSPAETVNDLLKYAAGVDVRQRGAFGMQTDISMRGGTYNQVAVLLNGINITDPQTGHNSFDFPVNICDIDHIEVLEGPAALVYGTSALVGAINIVTKGSVYNKKGAANGVFGPNLAARGDLNLEVGSFGYAAANGAVSVATDRTYNMFSASYQCSEGFNRNSEGGLNSDFSVAKAFLHGGTEFKSRNLTWQAGVSNKDFGSSTFYSPKFDNQFEHTLKTFAAVKSEGRGLLHFSPALYWNHNEDRFELFRDEPDKYPFNYHKTNVIGLNLNFYVDSKLGRTSFGTEARHEAIRSTNLGEPLESPDGKYVCGLARTAYNLFLEHNVTAGPLTASAGLTAVYNTGNNEGVKFFPGADVSLRITDAARVFASYNTSYRMPTFTDLYYSVGGHRADPNLRSEKFNAFEFGAKYYGLGVRLTASMFFNTGYDMIDWIMDTSAGEDAPWTSVNHTKINSVGEEFLLQLNFAKIFNVRKPIFNGLTFTGLHMSQSKTLEEHLRSLYSMEYVKNKLAAQADLRFPWGISANVAYTYVDRATESELIKPYHLLDAKVSCNFLTHYTAYIRLYNILNRPWYDFGDIPQPGIWIIGGFSMEIF